MENDIFSIDVNGNLVVTTCVDYDFEGNEAAYDQICEYIEELAPVSKFERVYKEAGDFSDWDKYAQQGLYAYDNYDGEKPVLISKPLSPMTVNDIPESIEKLLKLF